MLNFDRISFNVLEFAQLLYYEPLYYLLNLPLLGQMSLWLPSANLLACVALLHILLVYFMALMHVVCF